MWVDFAQPTKRCSQVTVLRLIPITHIGCLSDFSLTKVVSANSVSVNDNIINQAFTYSVTYKLIPLKPKRELFTHSSPISCHTRFIESLANAHLTIQNARPLTSGYGLHIYTLIKNVR